MTIELRRLQRPMLAISLALGLLAGCGGGSDGDAGTGAPPPVGTPGDPAPLPPTPPSPVPETPAPESPDSAPTAPSISGTIVPGKTSSLEDAPWATFYAPAAVPSVNPVAVSVDYWEHTPDAPHLKLVSNVTIVSKPDCSWLHSVQTLYYEMEMQYSFSGAGPRGMLTLDQYGLILGEMTQQFDGEPYGVWRGYSTRGHATVSDQHTYGSLISVLYGSGTPDIGEDVDYSVATLVVDYQTCTYTVTGQVAVLASAGGREPPSVRNIAAFTRGNLPIDLDTGLIGREYMPPRLQADPAGTYFPGGLGIGMVADGYATEASAGKALVRWSVWP